MINVGKMRVVIYNLLLWFKSVYLNIKNFTEKIFYIYEHVWTKLFIIVLH